MVAVLALQHSQVLRWLVGMWVISEHQYSIALNVCPHHMRNMEMCIMIVISQYHIHRHEDCMQWLFHMYYANGLEGSLSLITAEWLQATTTSR